MTKKAKQSRFKINVKLIYSTPNTFLALAR